MYPRSAKPYNQSPARYLVSIADWSNPSMDSQARECLGQAVGTLRLHVIDFGKALLIQLRVWD